MLKKALAQPAFVLLLGAPALIGHQPALGASNEAFCDTLDGTIAEVPMIGKFVNLAGSDLCAEPCLESYFYSLGFVAAFPLGEYPLPRLRFRLAGGAASMTLPGATECVHWHLQFNSDYGDEEERIKEEAYVYRCRWVNSGVAARSLFTSFGNNIGSCLHRLYNDERSDLRGPSNVADRVARARGESSFLARWGFDDRRVTYTVELRTHKAPSGGTLLTISTEDEGKRDYWSMLRAVSRDISDKRRFLRQRGQSLYRDDAALDERVDALLAR